MVNFNKDFSTLNSKSDVGINVGLFSTNELFDEVMTFELISSIIKEDKSSVILLMKKGAYLFSEISKKTYSFDDEKFSGEDEELLSPIESAIISASPNFVEFLLDSAYEHYKDTLFFNSFKDIIENSNEKNKQVNKIVGLLVSNYRLDLFPVFAKYGFFNQKIVDVICDLCVSVDARQIKYLEFFKEFMQFDSVKEYVVNKENLLINIFKLQLHQDGYINGKVSSNVERCIDAYKNLLSIPEVKLNLELHKEEYVKEIIELKKHSVGVKGSSVELATFWANDLGLNFSSKYQCGGLGEISLLDLFKFKTDEEKSCFLKNVLSNDFTSPIKEKKVSI